MYLVKLQIVTAIAAILLAATAFPVPGGTRDAGSTVADLPEAECRRALDIMFSGRPVDAAEYIDALEEAYGEGPLYRLTRARVYREALPVDDEDKEVLKALAEPIYADLDRAIAYCDRRIEAGSDDTRLLLYRGWAWMFKSHIRTFERSFWSAGRDARKGRNDLRDYLEIYPEDPIANGIMGTFLYFADTLPAAFKFISKLLFMPTGDREEGLRRMMHACEYRSLIEVDNKTLLFSVYIAFEGRYEDGLHGFQQLNRRYPDYPSFIRPFGLTLPFTPRDRSRNMALLDRALDESRNASRIHQDSGPYVMLRFTRAYADRFYDPETARRRFEAIVADDPAHPDWVTSYSAFELARQLAARGDREGARPLLRRVLEDESGGYLHGEARTMLDEIDRDYSTSATVDVPVPRIYKGNRDEVAAIAETLRDPRQAGVQTEFYLGEALLMLGDDDGAVEAFEAVIERDVPIWDEAFQLIACSRLAEIYGSRLQYDDAARYLDMAPQFYHKEFLYDWLFEGRKRFYERVSSGEYTATPTLFSNIP